MQITVYTQPGCGPCTVTKSILERRGAEFAEVDVTEEPTAREQLLAWGYAGTPVTAVSDLPEAMLEALGALPRIALDGSSAHWHGLRPDALDVIAPRS